jgi:X-X-X-Leu-X-X-Gly heptad repeat protein
MPEYKYVDFYAKTDKESPINTTEDFLKMAYLMVYADKFREEKVKVSELKDLTKEQLNGLGMIKPLHKERFRRHADRLVEIHPPANKAASGASEAASGASKAASGASKAASGASNAASLEEKDSRLAAKLGEKYKKEQYLREAAQIKALLVAQKEEQKEALQVAQKGNPKEVFVDPRALRCNSTNVFCEDLRPLLRNLKPVLVQNGGSKRRRRRRKTKRRKTKKSKKKRRTKRKRR